MDDRSRLDSATALARTPLFSHLGRLDLARLAGELEELHFAAGKPIVREGDPADGFYIVNSGRVSVITRAPVGDGAPIATLGAGECFGELALLTDSPRTATVVAATDVTVWRLSRTRFDALLGHERSIAASIERSLSHRLAVTSHEAGAFRAVARALLLRSVSPAAARLMGALLARPEWPREVVAGTCAQTGRAEALAELEALPGFLRRDGATLVVDRAFAALADGLPAPGPAAPAPGAVAGHVDEEWCAAAADDLAAAGDPVRALDLDFAAGALERARRRLVEHEASILASASPADIDRWLARQGGVDPGLAERLRVLRRYLSDGAAVLPSRPGAPRLRRPLPGPRLVGAALALGLFLLGWLLPLPPGLGRPALAALAAIVGTVPLLVFDVLPDYVVMLLLAFALVVPGLVPPETVLSGFATPAWIMILTLVAVGAAVSRSGLMFRLVLLSLQRLPPGFVPQSLLLCGTGVVLTAGMTSGATRIALGVPIARGIADAMGFGPRSAGSAAIGLLTFFSFLQMGELFMTGTFTGLVVHDLMPAGARQTITWWRWVFVAAPVFAVVFALNYATVLLLFKPHRDARVNLRAIQLQHALLGPITRNEIWSAVVLVSLVVGFATRELHGLAPAWLATAAFLFLFALGAVDQASLQGGGTIGLLVYSGVILSLGTVFGILGIDAWLGSLVRSGMPAAIANPYGFVLVVGLVAFGLHFFVPWMTASTLLALVTMPLAEGLGFHPFIAVMVTLIGGDHTILPYVNPGYPIVYFASEGQLFSHAQARRPLVLEAVYRMTALLLAVPVWQLTGLM